MKSYRVVPLKTGFFTARLDEAKLEALLNENARAGWTLKTTVKDETRGMLPGSKREAVFLISNARDKGSLGHSTSHPIARVRKSSPRAREARRFQFEISAPRAPFSAKRDRKSTGSSIGFEVFVPRRQNGSGHLIPLAGAPTSLCLLSRPFFVPLRHHEACRFLRFRSGRARVSVRAVPAVSPLNRVLTEQRVRKLASETSFDRGKTYFRERRVLSLVQRGAVLTASVRGSEGYAVRLEAADRGLQHRCSCPVGGDGVFCKHAVAVALAWLAEGHAKPEDTSPVVKLDDVQPWLLQQEKSTLASWLLDAAERDARLRERLLRLAARATQKRTDFSTYRRAIDRATPTGDFVSYDEARDVTNAIREAAIEPLRELLQEGHAVEVIPLAEHALRRIERVIENVDDSAGHFGALLGELQELHLDACRAARPDPEELAARLFDWELNGHWDVFHGAAETYAEVLGEKGAAVYRRRAEAAWKSLPALGPHQREDHSTQRFHLTSIMEALARTSGDLDALVAIKAKNLSHAHAFLQIAELYRDAKRHDDALAWAERGVKAFPKDTSARLIEFLATEYHRRGRHDDAMALVWRHFESRPTLENYQFLKRHAERAKTAAWPSWRERALAFLRQRIVSAPSRSRRSVLFFSADATDRSTLVEILLSENDVAAAWREAQTGECHYDLMLRLASAREKTHPADALPIYLRHAERLVAQTNNRAYDEAAKYLKKVKVLHLALDQPREWAALHARLCAEHKAKRNFMALIVRL